MPTEKSVFIPSRESLVFPQVPAYFPERYQDGVAEYVDYYILSALNTALRRQKEQKEFEGTDSVRFWQSVLIYYGQNGFLLPEERDPADVRENHFSISSQNNVGTSHIGQCLGGVMVNEVTREGIGFHIWPLSNWKGQESFRYAIGYWKTLMELVPIKPTRFDFAASTGGWCWSFDRDNHRKCEESESHRIMFEAFRHVFGTSTKFSRWTTAQIQYDPSRNEVFDPLTQRTLPKEGATGYWVDLLSELDNPSEVLTNDSPRVK